MSKTQSLSEIFEEIRAALAVTGPIGTKNLPKNVLPYQGADQEVPKSKRKKGKKRWRKTTRT